MEQGLGKLNISNQAAIDQLTRELGELQGQRDALKIELEDMTVALDAAHRRINGLRNRIGPLESSTTAKTPTSSKSPTKWKTPITWQIRRIIGFPIRMVRRIRG